MQIKTSALSAIALCALCSQHAYWSIGFGQYADFGLAANYDNDWPGRYFAQNASWRERGGDLSS